MKKQLKKIGLILTLSVCSVVAALACSGTLYIAAADERQARQDFDNNCPKGSSMTLIVVETNRTIELAK